MVRRCLDTLRVPAIVKVGLCIRAQNKKFGYPFPWDAPGREIPGTLTPVNRDRTPPNPALSLVRQSTTVSLFFTRKPPDM